MSETTAEKVNPDNVKGRIDLLEKQKGDLIEQIKALNRRIRYKKYEQKALAPFLEQTKDVEVSKYRKMKRSLEFKISTAAYTPAMERDLLKKMRKIDEQLEEVKEVEKARRKIRYVEKDIEEGEAEIVQIEEKLKVIRDELKGLYENYKDIRAIQRKEAQAAAKAEEDMVALGDLAFIEK